MSLASLPLLTMLQHGIPETFASPIIAARDALNPLLPAVLPFLRLHVAIFGKHYGCLARHRLVMLPQTDMTPEKALCQPRADLPQWAYVEVFLRGPERFKTERDFCPQRCPTPPPPPCQQNIPMSHLKFTQQQKHAFKQRFSACFVNGPTTN
ncbi:hypothetical protein BDK51DRAFT_34948 [Blyttiomyces helicus]|uniref:Uncharacterized protein n=1 Tax=Blyttiomyces helicus TaxID=388810 RepID=A0A4V1IQA1_9FUNG|nr:hypothetical protein BDK51DRAFT_34948 [Blyttiomyces helicus]|eukprot:RKO85837.1 hypothetical protein BDK51DRAFT_34948 [Blyttiomyces helicus]